MKYNMDKFYYLQQQGVDMIDQELDDFFDTRFQLAITLSELYLQGSLRHMEDLLAHLNISKNEIENLVETINQKLCKTICLIHNMDNLSTDNFIGSFLDESRKYLDEDLAVMGKTETIADYSEMLINQSIYIIFERVFQGNVLSNIFQNSNYAGKLLNYHSLEKQKRKHNELLQNQVNGFLINLKTELRNKLVRSVLSSIASIDPFEDTIVA